jgi:Trk-type K+ transport system membrane component
MNWAVTGIPKGKAKELVDETLKLKRGHELSDHIVDRNIKLLKEHFGEKGFLDCEIEVKIEPDTVIKQAGNVTFDVKKNQRVRIGAITFDILPMYENLSDALRLSAFQVCTVVSTTGYATADFNLWPGLSKALLLLLMFVGGCAGSTGGGLKAVRVVILIKSIKKELKRLLHPRSVKAVMSEGKKLDDETLNGVTSYFAVYTICIIVVFILLSFEPFDFETNFTASVACFNNIGPGFGGVGPAASFAEYSIFSKIVLSFAMLLGRLEVFPLLLGLNPLILKKTKGS